MFVPARGSALPAGVPGGSSRWGSIGRTGPSRATGAGEAGNARNAEVQDRQKQSAGHAPEPARYSANRSPSAFSETLRPAMEARAKAEAAERERKRIAKEKKKKEETEFMESLGLVKIYGKWMTPGSAQGIRFRVVQILGPGRALCTDGDIYFCLIYAAHINQDIADFYGLKVKEGSESFDLGFDEYFIEVTAYI